VLDYNFYTTEKRLTLVIGRGTGEEELQIRKEQYTPLGLDFETYLMDRQKSCANRCIFCFIDQLPKGMRESLYFKDDDVRLSFLLGNYVTMTNFSEHDIDRITEMKISPINISVHTTSPELRVRMLRNKNAGRCLEIIDRFKEAGIRMNMQIVLCPGWNDGEELERTLHDLVARAPEVESIAIVPLGLTGHREGLVQLDPVTPEIAAKTLEQCRRWGDLSMEYYGERRVYPSDEFYLLAGLPIPEPESYEGYPQLENGVGLLALLKEEFTDALEDCEVNLACELSIATGEAAGPYIRALCDMATEKYPDLKIHVYVVKNEFFGGGVTVTGLLTGRDIRNQLIGKPLGGKLLIVRDMLRSGEEVFLDDMTVEELSSALGVPVEPTEKGGDALMEALIRATEERR